MSILIDTPSDPSAACAMVVDAIDQWEKTLSRFDPHSELNQLARLPDQWQPISPVLWEVLKTADWAYERTAGIIDPTIRTTLERHGYNTTYTAINGTQPTQTPFVSTWRTVRIDPQQPRVWVPAGVALDLAGVAKSWAAQHALALLTDYPAAAIDAAGDLCVHGIPSDSDAWPIGIDALPGFAEPDMLALTHNAIATSGTDKRRWTNTNGVPAHHIIDPRTGAPSQSDVIRASVIAPTIVEADIAARTLVILGKTEGFAWLARLPDHAALVHCADGTTAITPTWDSHLWIQST